MSLLKRNPLFNSLVRFSDAGMTVATYSEIKTALVSRYKEIYGDDIDISPATADGQYIEMICLIINNALQSLQLLYGNLDVNTAQGKFLDILASLTNVVRKEGTHSMASIKVALTQYSKATLTVGPSWTQSDVEEINFADKNGVIWTFRPETQYSFTVGGDAQTITIYCDEIGPVSAPVGWINETVDGSIIMSVVQETQAELGSYKEADYELRARRNQSLGLSGQTVLQSLVGALLSIEGIDDVKIYNNDNATSTMTAKDGTQVLLHNVYAVIRKKPLANISDDLVGSTLYEKMTPGVHFTKPKPVDDPVQDTDDTSYQAINGEGKNYTYVQYYQGQPVAQGYPQVVSWKYASSVNPIISISIKPLPTSAENLHDFDVDGFRPTLQKIVDRVVDYMNNLSLSTDAEASLISMQAQLADPLFRGMPTYMITGADINVAESDWQNTYVNRDAYYKYDKSNWMVDDWDGEEIIINIGDVL